ncbi:hypothetical protein LTR28_001315 [Elasticomyces elasticus]|nr:hypothetical protein LTR28_001315 [Elasticomyces elasticus]
MGEIAGCEGYDHQYQSLPLLPVDDFLALRPELRDADEDTIMQARIDHEHAGRLALEEQRQALLKKKQAMAGENNKMKDELAGLDKEIEKLVSGAQAVESVFLLREAKGKERREKKEARAVRDAVRDSGAGT